MERLFINPLTRLNKLSKELKVNNIFYKDESKRFNLKSFKALGGAYAVKEISKKNKMVISQQLQKSWKICCMGCPKT